MGAGPAPGPDRRRTRIRRGTGGRGAEPGIHSETAFDQAYLAGVLGFPLVESADLVVRDGKLWMRSLGTLKRVDVVLRRVDADYVDPLDLRPIPGWASSGWSRCCAAVR